MQVLLASLLGILVFLSTAPSASGQDLERIQEAEEWLKKPQRDSVYIDKVNYLCNVYALSGKNDPLPLIHQALRLSDSLGYVRGRGMAHMNLAIYNDIRGEYHSALENYLISLKLLKKARDEDNLAHLLQNLGYFYSLQGNYKKAIEVTKEAADLIYKNWGEKRASYCWSNLGHYYAQTTDYDSALYFTLRAYEQLKVEKDTAGLADVFFNLANISWKADKNPKKALNYAMQALEFYIANPIEVETYIDCKSFIGEMHLRLGNYAMAEYYLKESLVQARQHRLRYLMKNIYRSQAELYATMGVWQKAYESHSRFFQLHDSIYNEQSTNRVEQLKAEYELESREAKIELLKQSKIIQDDELERQMIIRNSFMALFGLFLLVAGVLYKNNRSKQQANQLLTRQKHQIEEQNREIIKQNELLEEQKKELLSQASYLNQASSQISRQQEAIEQKTSHITSSLEYARRIQDAMLPQPAELKVALPDSFIWLKPKEIVSGDFYWFAQVRDKIFLAALDCTGQGVPGAFMSLIGDLYLNQIILQEEVQQADQILNRLNEHVHRSLNTESAYSQDGMEAALCVIDLQLRELQFAGARSSLYYSKGEAIEKVKGDRQYVGGTSSKAFSGFTVHRLSFLEATSFYLCTDGVRDQFGGKTDKKFGERRFMDLLKAHVHLPMEQQKEKIRQSLQDWMQQHEQTDDMMVMGWRL
ncbi:SpoIIE family protein phosphatase [Cesiribacter andamanensis]|uniref:Phosphoserine phosphatase rsbP n=1 Tax=Cesiribacter andamanensis AMV16 TaxID=1279009 RepID=M7N0Y6_9BACT|nr:SpoIIE family protein phosphatase [Cesiribacter andamanensis]EMR00972.1 Phosphoserine phosphatase rsbP [Cesiribacter andamanensis AMV16]